MLLLSHFNFFCDFILYETKDLGMILIIYFFPVILEGFPLHFYSYS